jgi:hypothetical protein
MTLSKTAKRRLNKLITFMASLPKSANKHFSMEQWAEHPGGFEEHGFGSGAILPKEAPMLCGTTACALGWACSVPSFYKAGFRLKTSNGMRHAYPTFGAAHTDEAAKRFFDIDGWMVSALFHADDIRTPKQWARHASALLKRWDAA